ncbi:MAG: hypothetical protein R2880_21335 [Deinococcales bacterium]
MTSQAKKAPSTLSSVIITQAIAIFGFVIVPILITLVAPLSRVRVEYLDGKAVATITRYVLLFIPWKTERIEGVTGARADTTTTHTRKATSAERQRGDSSSKLVFATGQIALLRGEQESIVQAAPELATETANAVNVYLAEESKQPLEKTLYASWSLSYILGGIMTALCGLYVVGAALAIITFPFKKLRKLNQ